MNIVQCYGLTRDSSDGNYMLVMFKMDTDLRNYLRLNHCRLDLSNGISIINNITRAVHKIHSEGSIHRDLHSGNVLYSQTLDYWYISDLGFCGPADKPLKKLYGNLPYIAPEVIIGRPHTFASDIYSIGMLMWEILFGQPPFSNCVHDFDLAMKIVNGMRPNVVPETPLEYSQLMKQCWDAGPLKRPDIHTLYTKIKEINKSGLVQQAINYLTVDKNSTDCYSGLFTSKIHKFINEFSEPRNATEGQYKVFE